jgi:hypothetical protein
MDVQEGISTILGVPDIYLDKSTIFGALDLDGQCIWLRGRRVECCGAWFGKNIEWDQRAVE